MIVGIDPGLNATGYGAITASGREVQFITAGDIRPPRGKPLAQRLEFLHHALTALLTRQHPNTLVLEMVFTHERYANTAALMGHARGVACLVAQQQHIPVVEYPPARIKQALTGRGAASKDQVARMVTQWMGVRDPSWSFDATDALALAIAHAHMQSQHPLTVQKGRSRVRSAPACRLPVAERRQTGAERGAGRECGVRSGTPTHSEFRIPNSEFSAGWAIEG